MDRIICKRSRSTCKKCGKTKPEGEWCSCATEEEKALAVTLMTKRFSTFERVDGKLGCTCGASCEKSERARFLRRHPEKCTAALKEKAIKVAFSKKLAAGTRSVDGDARREAEWEEK